MQQLLYSKAWYKNNLQPSFNTYIPVSIVEKNSHARTLVFNDYHQQQQQKNTSKKNISYSNCYYVNDADLLPRSGLLPMANLLYLNYINFPEFCHFIDKGCSQYGMHSRYIRLGSSILIDTESQISQNWINNKERDRKRLQRFYREQIYNLLQKQNHIQGPQQKKYKKYTILIPQRHKCSHLYLKQFLNYIKTNKQLCPFINTQQQIDTNKISSVLWKLLHEINLQLSWKYQIISQKFNQYKKMISLQFTPYICDSQQSRFVVPEWILSAYDQKYYNGLEPSQNQVSQYNNILEQQLLSIGFTQDQQQTIMKLTQSLYLLNKIQNNLTTYILDPTQQPNIQYQNYLNKISQLLQINRNHLKSIINLPQVQTQANKNIQSQNQNQHQYQYQQHTLQYQLQYPGHPEHIPLHKIRTFTYIIYEFMVCKLCYTLTNNYSQQYTDMVTLSPLNQQNKQNIRQCYYQFSIYSFGATFPSQPQSQPLYQQQINKHQQQTYQHTYQITTYNIISTILHQHTHTYGNKTNKPTTTNKIHENISYEQKLQNKLQQYRHTTKKNQQNNKYKINCINIEFYIHQLYNYILGQCQVIPHIITNIFKNNNNQQISIFNRLRYQLRSIPSIWQSIYNNYTNIQQQLPINPLHLSSCTIIAHKYSILSQYTTHNQLINRILQAIRISQANLYQYQYQHSNTNSNRNDGKYIDQQVNEKWKPVSMSIQQFIQRYMYTPLLTQLFHNNPPPPPPQQQQQQQQINNRMQYKGHKQLKKQLIQKYLSISISTQLDNHHPMQQTNPILDNVKLLNSNYFHDDHTTVRIENAKLYRQLEHDVYHQYQCVVKISNQYIKYRNRIRTYKLVTKASRIRALQTKIMNICNNNTDICSALSKIKQKLYKTQQGYDPTIPKPQTAEQKYQQDKNQKQQQYQSSQNKKQYPNHINQHKQSNQSENRSKSKSHNSNNSNKTIKTNRISISIRNRSNSNLSKHTQVQIRNTKLQHQHASQQNSPQQQKIRYRVRSLHTKLQIQTQILQHPPRIPRQQSQIKQNKQIPKYNFLNPNNIYPPRQFRFQLSSPSEQMPNPLSIITPDNQSLMLSDPSFQNTPQSSRQLNIKLSPKSSKQVLTQIRKQLKVQKNYFRKVKKSQKSDNPTVKSSSKQSIQKSSQTYSKNQSSQFMQKSQNLQQLTKQQFNSFQDQSPKNLPQWFKNCHISFDVQFTRKQLFQKCTNKTLPIPRPHPQIMQPKPSKQLMQLLQEQDFVTYTRNSMDCVSSQQYYNMISNQNSQIQSPLLLAYPKRDYPNYYKQAFNAILKIGLQKNSKKKIHQLLNVIIVPLYESYYQQLKQNQKTNNLFDQDSMLCNDYQSHHNILKDQVFLYFLKQISPSQRELFPQKFMLGYLFGLCVLTRYFCPSPNFLYPFTHYMQFIYKKQLQNNSDSLEAELLQSIFTNLLLFVTSNEGFKRNYVKAFQRNKTIVPQVNKTQIQCSGYLYPRDTPITQYQISVPLKGQKIQLPCLRVKLPNQQSFTIPIRNQIIKTIKKKVLSILGFVQYEFVFFLYIREQDRSFTQIDQKSKAIKLFNLQQQSKRNGKYPISIYIRLAYYLPYAIKDVGTVRMIYLNLVMDEETFPWKPEAYQTIVAMSKIFNDFQDLRMKNYLRITNQTKKSEQNMQIIKRKILQIKDSLKDKPFDYQYLLYLRRADRIYMKCFEKIDNPNQIVVVRPYIIQFYDKKQSYKHAGISLFNIKNVYIVNKIVVLEIYITVNLNKKKQQKQIKQNQKKQQKQQYDSIRKSKQKQTKPKTNLNKVPPKPQRRILKTLTLRDVKRYEQLFKTILFYLKNIKTSNL